MIHRMDDAARAAAGTVREGPLAGVPFLLKDIGAHVAGAPYTEGSKVLKDYVAEFDSELAARFKRAGLVVCGTTNVPEFGYNATTEPDFYGPCRNPWNTERTTGGSSGSSAAAVASGMVPIAHATDGGGSIRIPAAACGLVGLKPTRMRNPWGPDAGDVLFGLAVEHVVSRSVRDSATALEATAGNDLGAPYAAPAKAQSFTDEVGADPGRLRVAFSTEAASGERVHADCVAAVHEVAKLCEDLGHTVVEAAPRFAEHDKDAAVELFLILASALSASSMAVDYTTLIGHRPSLDEVEISSRAVIEHGLTLSTVDLIQAVSRMHRIGREVARFMVDHDVLLTPTLAAPPIPLGILAPHHPDLVAHTRNIFAFAAFTPLANITGQPAIALPLCHNAENLPVGPHFAARFGDEATLFRLADQLEEAKPWAARRPPIYG
jgi:amidase